MKIPMAVLADEANVSQEGKLNLMGIFDRIAAAEFPVVHPKMVFAFRVEADSGDSGRAFPVQVSMEDEDGTAIFQADGEMMAPPVPPGEFSTANQIFALVGVQFPRPGIYRFVVRVGDSARHEAPFLVQHSARDSSMN
ncbi:MAG TPA: hypothetical protein VEQ60_22820 [Longimicrobium sp.]|nr:hypothetical protein [Longimicrobium sp.]